MLHSKYSSTGTGGGGGGGAAAAARGRPPRGTRAMARKNEGNRRALGTITAREEGGREERSGRRTKGDTEGCQYNEGECYCSSRSPPPLLLLLLLLRRPQLLPPSLLQPTTATMAKATTMPPLKQPSTPQPPRTLFRLHYYYPNYYRHLLPTCLPACPPACYLLPAATHDKLSTATITITTMPAAA